MSDELPPDPFINDDGSEMHMFEVHSPEEAINLIRGISGMSRENAEEMVHSERSQELVPAEIYYDALDLITMLVYRMGGKVILNDDDHDSMQMHHRHIHSSVNEDEELVLEIHEGH